MPLYTLDNIRTKVRRLTRTPSPALLSDQNIDDYINTFILYDIPEHLRLFSLKTTFSFYTTPNVAEYATDPVDVDAPLYNFKNKYISVHNPFYVAGNERQLLQSREVFYATYPKNSFLHQIATGDGTTQYFTGFLYDVPVLQSEVLFDSIDVNNNSCIVIDAPVFATPAIGNLIVPNNPDVVGYINYITGQYAFTFPIPPAPNKRVNAQTYPYIASIPQTICYFDNKFTLRPVPDQAYKIQMEVYVRPTELLLNTDEPHLEQWWQWIAYGAAKKVFEDKQDLDSVALIMPEFTKQELLVLRSTIVQQTKNRTPTIYSENNNNNFGPGIFNGIGSWW